MLLKKPKISYNLPFPCHISDFLPFRELFHLTAESFIEAFPDKIISSHISDNDLYLDRHVPIGEGKIDFRRVLNLLKDIGFEGTLNIELKTNEDRLVSKQRLEPILRELGIQQ